MPCKTIRTFNGQAEVIPERCIACGNCVRVCSQDAKVFVDCREQVKIMLKGERPVYAMVAASFPAEFTEIENHRVLVGMIRALGFARVMEVSFGADMVAKEYPVTVLVADDVRTLTPHAEMPAQTFLAGGGTVDLSVNSVGAAEGNHGFFVASLIGARFDDVGTTGLFADPGGVLRLPCLATDGLGSWIAVLADLSDNLPATGKFMLNTRFGYIPDFMLVPKRERAEHAFFWRFLVTGRQNRFLHTQASGNEGNASPSLQNADNGSPFALSARFNTPLENVARDSGFTPPDT